MKEIKDFTDIELKAIAFDLIQQFNMAQQQLQIINAELQKRQQNTLTKKDE